jgi:hypothetical protein
MTERHERITLDTPIKFLREDGSGTHSEKRAYPIGKWMRVRGKLSVCENGYHYTTPRYWREWLTTRVHLVEATAERLEGIDKVCARGIKLAPRLETWTPRTAALLAADCAEHVLHLFERQFPGDPRPRQEIEAVRPESVAAAWAVWAAADAADAARGAAGAARAALAAADAAGAEEREWQNARFLAYLNREV